MEKNEMKGGVLNECLLINIFPTGCAHGQVGRGVSQMQTAADRGRDITKNKKSLKCADILYGWPLFHQSNLTRNILKFWNTFRNLRKNLFESKQQMYDNPNY